MHKVTYFKSQTVDSVQSYKYLETIIDSKLSFEANCEAVCRKGHQRLFFLRKLCKFHIDKTLLIINNRSSTSNQFYHFVWCPTGIYH